MTGALGIIAGGGELPRAIAESARASGRKVFVLGLNGMTATVGARISARDRFPRRTRPRDQGPAGATSARDVTLAGKVQRPKFSEIKLDAKAMLAAPRVIAAALKGDDALLRSVVDMFEREGMRVVGAAEAAPGLIARRRRHGSRAAECGT